MTRDNQPTFYSKLNFRNRSILQSTSRTILCRELVKKNKLECHMCGPQTFTLFTRYTNKKRLSYILDSTT